MSIPFTCATSIQAEVDRSASRNAPRSASNGTRRRGRTLHVDVSRRDVAVDERCGESNDRRARARARSCVEFSPEKLLSSRRKISKSRSVPRAIRQRRALGDGLSVLDARYSPKRFRGKMSSNVKGGEEYPAKGGKGEGGGGGGKGKAESSAINSGCPIPRRHDGRYPIHPRRRRT